MNGPFLKHSDDLIWSLRERLAAGAVTCWAASDPLKAR
jgi:hypothetical protein